MFLQTSLFQTYFNQTYLRVLKSESSFLSCLSSRCSNFEEHLLINCIFVTRQTGLVPLTTQQKLHNRLTKNQIVQFQHLKEYISFPFSGVCHHLASQKKLFDIRILQLHRICSFRVSFCTLCSLDFSAV